MIKLPLQLSETAVNQLPGLRATAQALDDDIEPIAAALRRLRRERGWSSGECERARIEFLQFMLLQHVTNDPISPSSRGDEVWHAFLLFTERYAAWCFRHFGRFVHHRPFSEDPNQRRREIDGARQSAALRAEVFEDTFNDNADCDSPSCHQCHGCGISATSQAATERALHSVTR